MMGTKRVKVWGPALCLLVCGALWIAISATSNASAPSPTAKRASISATTPAGSIGSPAAAWGVTGPFSLAQLPTIELNVATRDGDPAPSLVQHISATRQQANQWMSGDVVPGNAPAYLVAMRGNFSGPGGLVSADQPAPPTVHWTVELLVIDATTGAITDSGSADSFPNLAAHGPVITDILPSAG